ncbi:uncharacterized protein E0L32_002090 [Thyridium curvatum]|uniref:Zn(2)-C6 fungal-type domain-containing protein n=1 Tax=Thyridium curvatum TaxID=1093900 RepID=A0A507ATA3_9PEZI|nr:uncharacterized protein E0L32_002043 [Thyridium curvatum]XP_030989198.1 uncharacterized protein E0L32_002090 [Thyridium curvatum]TPX07440.1 hypothetical protein E0L32_002043 [Thyridium curvatum]TPX07487.1 hypothetical protein E0L32_002090 [Thyridium curvatum]
MSVLTTSDVELPPSVGKAKSVACRKCHSRKVKCPGGQPCMTCVQMACQDECVYPKRDRQIRSLMLTAHSYLNSIVQQNHALRTTIRSLQARETAPLLFHTVSKPEEHATTPDEDSSQNPVLGDNPWFVQQVSFSVPLRVGEGADTAFATRFRQSVLNVPTRHPPRIQYPTETQIAILSETGVSTPSATRAHFLVQAALANIDNGYHIVRSRSVWALLDRFLEGNKTLDSLSQSKIFALFAMGELYSSHCRASDAHPPGLQYFSLAFKSYGCLLERPSVDSIEVTLLLSLYSLCINRWHSAYFLASSALRHCAVMGLHFNIPEASIPDAATREHLRRVWWTSYILEIICAVNAGQMLRIEDDEVLVDPPTNAGLAEADQADFADPGFLLDMVRLRQRGSPVGQVKMSTGTSDALGALSQACSWIDGSFKTFDYTQTQYLFSVATIHAVSNFLHGPGGSKDQDAFEFAQQLMQELVRSGSVVAAEFSQHLEAIKGDMQGVLSQASNADSRPTDVQHASRLPANSIRTDVDSFTAQISDAVLNEPNLEAFLSQRGPGSDEGKYLDSSQLEDLYWPIMDFT